MQSKNINTVIDLDWYELKIFKNVLNLLSLCARSADLLQLPIDFCRMV